MDWLSALILGIVQGLAEFLPVSSSGHLELGRTLLGLEMSGETGLLFTVTVHAGTALSTVVVFYKDIVSVLNGLVKGHEEDRKFAGIQGIDEVRDQIERILVQQMGRASQERWLERLRRNGYIKHY